MRSIELARDGSGTTYIADWVMRLSRLESESGDAPPTLTGVLQVGGHVTRLRSDSGEVLAEPGAAALRGTIVDTAAHPVAGAEVRLAGTGHVGRTNDAGDFALEGLPAGLYRLLVFHADRAEAPSFGTDVSIDWTSAPAVTLALAARTGGSPASILGKVVDQATSQPVEGVEVGVAGVARRVVSGLRPAHARS